jgi:hypothetical protein
MARTRKYRRRKQSRRQRGGVGNLFTIYTTGILDAGNAEPGSIRDIWLNGGVLDKILSCIPREYNRIQIVHFDPHRSKDGDRMAEFLASEKTRSRVENAFHNENIPLELILEMHGGKDYIIIDSAHILRPTGNLQEFNYNPSDKHRNLGGGINHRLELKTGKFNALYLGYPLTGSIQPFKFFDVKDGVVTSFKDKLLINGWPPHYMYDYPRDTIQDFFGKLRRISSGIIAAKYRPLGYNINALDTLDIAFQSDIDRMIHDYLDRALWLTEPVVSYDIFLEGFKRSIELAIG